MVIADTHLSKINRKFINKMALCVRNLLTLYALYYTYKKTCVIYVHHISMIAVILLLVYWVLTAQ